jgi:hypothetical protein
MQLCAVFDLAFVDLVLHCFVRWLLILFLGSFPSWLLILFFLLVDLVCRRVRAACATTGAGGRLAS